MPEVSPNPPKPEPTAARAALIARVAAEGPITVAEFMSVAAAHYYAARDPFGVDGDFTTAPEISQMYGEMIGAWIVDGWMQLGKPEFARLIEFGPGRGTLAADIMRTISAWPDCKAAFQLHLIETSPLLRQMQADVLMNYNPTWHDKLEEVPPGVSFIVANEFFDALPIHQYIKTPAGWHERCVGYDAENDTFKFTTRPFEGAGFPPAPTGSIYETSPVSLSFMDQIAGHIAEAGGAALIVDYGHAKPGFGDTLQTLRRHQFTGVLENPGGDDITAHVDFAALAARPGETLSIHGPVEQGEFLTSLGIVQRAEGLREKASEEQRAEIDQALKRLVSPSAMGRLFKVLGLTRKTDTIHPAGFDPHPHPADEQPE
ncbi:MAG TPA: SAM-dependent methyltransferase [Patescibacteria group bacterium]|nr:SAM-dependent methyltransferase [Patescibacteria group bacterium]